MLLFWTAAEQSKCQYYYFIIMIIFQYTLTSTGTNKAISLIYICIDKDSNKSGAVFVGVGFQFLYWASVQGSWVNLWKQERDFFVFAMIVQWIWLTSNAEQPERRIHWNGMCFLWLRGFILCLSFLVGPFQGVNLGGLWRILSLQHATRLFSFLNWFFSSFYFGCFSPLSAHPCFIRCIF